MTAGPTVPGAIPDDPAELLAALPDDPHWLYARSLLLSGLARVRLGVAATAALVIETSTAVLVGRPDSELLRDTLDASPPGHALLVQEDAVVAVRAALPCWTARPFVLHTQPRPHLPGTGEASGVIVSDRSIPRCWL
ncbi:MAG: hypothetical protein ABI251_08465, partial [Mycobacteriaceae bacterium]